MHMFAAVLSVSAITKDVHAWNNISGKSGNVGHFFMALDISKMGNANSYERRIEEIIDDIKASELAEGADTIYYPGEKELTSCNVCLETGEIFVQKSVLEQISELKKTI